MVYPNPSGNEYECLPLDNRPVNAPSLTREFAWMERLFEEWFMTLDELKIAYEGAEAQRIRKLTARSDSLVSAIGELQPPRDDDVTSVASGSGRRLGQVVRWPLPSPLSRYPREAGEERAEASAARVRRPAQRG